MAEKIILCMCEVDMFDLLKMKFVIDIKNLGDFIHNSRPPPYLKKKYVIIAISINEIFNSR